MQSIKEGDHKINDTFLEIQKKNPSIMENEKKSLSPVTDIFNEKFKYFDKNQNKKWEPYKNYSYYNRKFTNKKRNEENRSNNRNYTQMTPHNTGQYLAHIHQRFLTKRKTSCLDKDINDLNFNEQIKCFEDEDDIEMSELGDIDKDMQIFREKIIKRRLSLGNEIQNIPDGDEKFDFEKDEDEVSNLQVREFESSIF